MSVSVPEVGPNSLSQDKVKKKALEQRQSPKTLPALLWDGLACFRSVHLAIVLLALLALGVLVGVLMPQEGLVETSQIKDQFGDNYRILKAMGLFNVYSSYWFLTLEVLFFFSLLFGSFQWLRPAFLAATRRVYCGPEHIRVSPHHFWLETMDSEADVDQKVTRMLKKRGYQVHIASDDTKGFRLYADKGSFSRIGPVVAHFGILVLLVASVFGAFTGFKAQKIVAPGENFTLANVDSFMPNVDRQFWQGNVPDWTVSVHDFQVKFYEQDPTTPQQFIADLEVTNNQTQEQLARQEISVNHPLAIGDMTFYQASFAPTGKLFLEIDGEPKTVEINTRFQDRPISLTELGDPADQLALIVFPFFVQQDPGVTRNHVRVFLHRGEGFVGAAPGQMPDNLQLFEGEEGNLNGLHIKFIKPEIATGLQMKKAPETAGIYLAFLIICIGTVMCFFSQRRIWVALEKPSQAGGASRLYFQYKTNKARLSFNKELDVLKRELFAQLATSAKVLNPMEKTA